MRRRIESIRIDFLAWIESNRNYCWRIGMLLWLRLSNEHVVILLKTYYTCHYALSRTIYYLSTKSPGVDPRASHAPSCVLLILCSVSKTALVIYAWQPFDSFLATVAYGRAYATVLPCVCLCLSVVCTECILAKWCVLEQKLLLPAYRKS